MAVSGRSHKEACAGCIVSLATPTRSSLKASRSVSSLSFAEKPRGSFSRRILAVEAPIHKGLDTPSQGVEQGGYREGGCHYCELREISWPVRAPKSDLGQRHTPEVEPRA